MSNSKRSLLSVCALLSGVSLIVLSSVAEAQPLPPPPPAPTPPSPVPPPPGQTPLEIKPPPAYKAPNDSPLPGMFGVPPAALPPGTMVPIDTQKFREALSEALKANTAGLTAEKAAQRARVSSPDVIAKREAVRAAAARVDEAMVSFFPRLQGTARYVRLSPATNSVASVPMVFAPGAQSGDVVMTRDPTTGQVVGPTNGALVAGSFSFPVLLNQYTFQGSLTVPISDYFLRIVQAYSAASMTTDAARLEKKAAESKAAADARIAFYSWVKAVGQKLVVDQAVLGLKEHLRDAKTAADAGRLAKVELLAIEAQVAGGELTAAQTEQYVRATEEQLRTLIRAEPGEKLTIGEDVAGDLSRMQIDVDALKSQALTNRAELKALEMNETAMMKSSSVTSASMWPRLDAFGNVTYANPNTRFFPQRDEFKGTWDIGVQLTWSPNDFFAARSASAQIDANTAKLRALREQAKDGISLEVTAAALEVRTADAAVDSALANLAAAEEATRVRRELLKLGKALNSDVIDADTALLRARLTVVNARIDQRASRAKLNHAVGVETK